jgi:glucoamylase
VTPTWEDVAPSIGVVLECGMRLAALVLLAPLLAAAAPGPSAATDGPGALSHFDLARKDCLGTATGRSSKVWYTVAGGVLSDVYSPTVDNTNVESLRYQVTDGRTFTDLQGPDTTYSVRATDGTGMSCEVTSTARSGKWSVVTRYVTDPRRDSVVMRVTFQPHVRDLQLWVRLDGSVNGNGGGGTGNGGADDATVDPATTAVVQSDRKTASNAVNRDYAVPTAMALRADRPFLATSSGFVGGPGDSLSASTRTALDGNVVSHARVDTSRGPVTLALGFGRTDASAIATAGASAHTPWAAIASSYAGGWAGYDAGLRRPPATLRAPYYLSANVLKASEDKTYPGAIVASLASPWGQAVSAGDAVFFGSYREVFARDLYESFTGLLAVGDLPTARDTVRFLFDRQQLSDGRFPRNSLLNGEAAPDTGGDQLDESAYPILMAWQAGLAGDAGLYPRIRAAADFVVAHGPSFGSERWEEQSGYSPSTIAAEIAGLVAAGAIADRHGDHAAAQVYRSTADHFQRSIKGWTVTTTGPYAPRYFIRLAKTGDPDAAISYGLGNGAPAADQRAVVDQGFLELTRLGILPASDPDVRASLGVVDQVLRRGDGFYRYGTSTPGTEDGYGDCWEPDPTGCTPSGTPWPTGNVGSGHPWPVLSGERAEQELQTGGSTASLLASMISSSSGVGLVPEQSWEDPGLPASPTGTAPESASIGFTTGGPAGSAAPLTWAQAQLARLIVSTHAPVEQPAVVRDRYVSHPAPAALPVTITGPPDGTVVHGGTVTVTGVTAPLARVVIAGTPTDIAGPTSTVSTVADRTGAFRATLATGFLTNVLTVTATRPGASGYARGTVVSEALPGPALLDVTDPTGDDHGPGTYAYPTAADFHPGAFDLERFQVIDAGPTVYLRAQLHDLTPAFGSALGAQLLDVFVHDPAKTAFSTSAPYPSRNFTLAAGSAWSSRIEVQGFAGPVFVTAAGAPAGTVTVTANQATRSIVLAVPKAQLGTPGPGWVFTVTIHGQDGYSGDQARSFAPTPQPYQFGVCPTAAPTPICAIDPGTAPKVIDTIAPPGVDQYAELDPTAAPIELHGVPVD